MNQLVLKGRNSGRPPKAIISKELAAQAALTVIDAEGIEALSLERVARMLGVRAPSLYYHLRNKAELLEEVAKLILIDAESAVEPPLADWREAVVSIAVATRRSILRHPHAAGLMLRFFPRHLMLQSYERWMDIYRVPLDTKMLLSEGVEKLTFGSALFSANCLAQDIAPMPEFDREQHPNLAAAIAANRRNEEEEFIEIMRRFLSAF